jgi:hypothetical protein
MFYPAVISSDGSDRTGKLVMSGAMRAAAVLGALLTGAAAGAGEHPRLLVDAAGLAKLRADAQREPGASILAAMDKALAGYKHDGGLMYDMAPRHQAALYLAGGDRKHAAAAEAKVLAMVRDREFWNNPGSKGLTRCAGALTVALAYDACHDVWPDAVRREVSAKLLSAAQGIMKSMGAGANTKLANNWQAVRYAGAGIAALACDEPGADKIAADAYGKLKAHLNANLGENGWNPEGIGYTVYPWIFTGPFGVAAHRARLGDLRTEVKRAALTHWTCFAGTTPIPHTDGLGLRADLSDDHPAYRGHGTAGLAFWYAPREQLPALRWMYDRLFGAGGDKSYDTMDAGGIYSLLFYPADVPAKNPAEVVGRTYTDRSHGVAIFRNRFADADDVVAVINAHSRQPDGCHGGPDTNTIRLLGLGGVWITGGGRTGNTAGQTNLFAGPPPGNTKGSTQKLGKLESVEFRPDGGGTAVATGSCMGVADHRRAFGADFSAKSGAAAVLVSAETSGNGRLWRLNTPEFNSLSTDGNAFVITGPDGATLRVTVLEPAAPAFRTGTVERGGGAGHVGFPFRGTKYVNNRWIEFDCDRNVLVVMTLQKGPAPKVGGSGTAGSADLTVGGLSIKVADGRVSFR